MRQIEPAVRTAAAIIVALFLCMEPTDLAAQDTAPIPVSG